MSSAGRSSASAEAVQELYRGSVVIDLLVASLVRFAPPPVDGKEYVDRVRGAGVTAINVTTIRADEDMPHTLEQVNAYYNLIEHNAHKMLLVRSVADVRRAKREGRLGVILGFQGAGPLEREWSTGASILYRLGLRIAQIFYNERNRLGDGCAEPENRGLTAYGHEVVRELNRLGVLIDLSHAGERTSLEAIEASSQPVVFTHSNPKALTNVFRNITDEQIKAVAARGGVVGVNPYSAFCTHKLGVRPTLEDFLDRVDYVARLIGPEQVAIGSDLAEGRSELVWQMRNKRRWPSISMHYAPEALYAEGFDRIECFPNVAEGLARRGYSNQEIQGILGENFLRVASQVWTPDPVMS